MRPRERGIGRSCRFQEETAPSAPQSALAKPMHPGLSLVHVPVYFGRTTRRLGAWGQWNVGNWCADVQEEWVQQDL